MTQPLNVLLADAAADNQVLFTHGLKQLELPHTINWARNYNELFETLERVPELNLAIIDIDTPWMNGKKCLHDIKAHAQYRQIPVIILTNFKNDNDINEVYEAGAHYYTIKPYASLNHVETLRKIFAIDWTTNPPIPPKEQFIINLAFV